MSIITIAVIEVNVKIDDFLPLTPLSLGVLLALADEDRHGYGILKELERESAGRVRAGTGTLYAALQRMTDEGLIEASRAAGAADDDARRRYYAITTLGREVARAELRRMARMVELGTEKRLVRGLRAKRAES
jgi:DNA-binding PadR family transcriptional regulator